MEPVNLSAIIIAYNYSTQFKQDSGLLKLNNKSILEHVIAVVNPLVDETLIVTHSQKHADAYAKLVSSQITLVVEPAIARNPLVAALQGFKTALGGFSLLVPHDAPFISTKILQLFFELCPGKSAVIPRAPDSQAEPLPAVYATRQALFAAEKALTIGKKDLGAFIEALQNVRYLSTLVIRQLDPDLKTFFRIKTPVDLKRAVALTKNQKHKRHG